MSDSESTRNKGVMNIEKRLNYLVENDIENEEIYILLKKLASIFINQNKYVYGYNGIEDVCHDVAADTWMAVLNGRRINAWIYYIGKMIKLSYVTKQRNLEHEVIDASNDPNLQRTIREMCAGSAISCTNEFDFMQRNLFLDNIGLLIKDVMSHTKFKEGTKEYLAVYTNVCLNVINDMDDVEYNYVRIDDHLKPFVKIIISQFKKEFRNSGFCESISDNVEEDLEMQLKSTEDYRKGYYSSI